MGKSTPRAPAPPDPVVTAQAQTASNEATARTNARLNRVDQHTPEGSLRYLEMPDDRWQAVQTLAPSAQRQFDLTNDAQETYGRSAVSQLRQVEGQLSNPFQPTGRAVQYGPDFTGIGDPNQSRDAVERALNLRLQPQQERDRAALETRLTQQGLQPGGEAWRAAFDDYNRGLNDSRLGVTAQAGQEQSRVFGLGMAQSQNSNAARAQDLQEQYQLRAQPVNEASALITGQTLQAPSWVNPAQATVAPTDYAGLVNNNYNAQMQQYNSALQRQQAGAGALAGLGGTLIGSAFGSPWLGGPLKGRFG